jgi:glycine hydroxymethyltransferase
VTTSTTHKTLGGPRGGIILARANADIEKKLNSALFPGSQGGPLMHVIAAKAVCFKEAMTPEFKTYQAQTLANARTMANEFQGRGYKIVSGGTDNHLFLLDLIAKKITGKDADATLGRANITVNKNAVPGDPKSPFVTSGLRIGTPAATRRGFKEEECRTVTHWMCDVLDDLKNDNMVATVKHKVIELCRRFPVYAQ